mmetsp:Transcript_26145/g.68627  ORF Transcript_26145/g.68627 Transcript_26145/m.68627 type:complete len:266 (-) Transcript_26145:249-1046(-)
MAGAAAKYDGKFTFQYVDRDFGPLKHKETCELLKKWTMFDSMRVSTFRFDQKFAAFELKDFLKDMFNSAEVLAHLQTLVTVRGHWAAMGGSPGDCKGVDFEDVSCSATSMEFFDRLYECEALRRDGSIVGCFPEYLDNGFAVNQELGKIMLMEDSDHYDTFTDNDRAELLFKIFQHITLGGPLNQYEDTIGPYFDTTKLLYKSLISVAKDPKTQKVRVTSMAVKIKAADGRSSLFPQDDHPQNFMYAVVNPTKREVSLWYHAWCG